MKRPSRGERASAATTRYVGCLVLPIRMRRSFTAIVRLLPLLLFLVHPPTDAGDTAHLLHHLLHLVELLEQKVDVADGCAAAHGDPLTTRTVHELRCIALLPGHAAND